MSVPVTIVFSWVFLFVFSFITRIQCEMVATHRISNTLTRNSWDQSLMSSGIHTSSLFTSHIIEHGKSILQCRPQVASTIVEHKFHFLNAFAQAENISNDGFVSILLTFAAEPKTPWDRLTIVLGANTSSELNYIHSQDRYAASPRALIRNRREQFYGMNLFDAYISLPKAGLRFHNMGYEVHQLPANSYFIDVYFENHEARKSKNRKVRQIVDCVRIDKAYTIQLVELKLSLPSVVYAIEQTTIEVPNLASYLLGNSALIGRARVVGEFQEYATMFAPSCNATMEFPVDVISNKTTLSFVFPLCPPANWELQVNFTDGIHVLNIELYSLSRFDDELAKGVLAQDASAFLNAASAVPTSQQLSVLLSMVPQAQSKHNESSYELNEMLSLPSFESLMSITSGVNDSPGFSAAILANVLLIVQSIEDNITSPVFQASAMRATQISQRHNNMFGVVSNNEECSVLHFFDQLSEFRDETKKIMKLATTYRSAIIYSLRVPYVNIVTAAGVLVVIGQYISHLVSIIETIEAFNRCSVECTQTNTGIWPVTEELQCQLPKPINDLHVVTQSFSLAPSSCIALYFPEIVDTLRIFREDFEFIASYLPEDFQEFVHIDRVNGFFDKLFDHPSSTNHVLTASDIISISYQDNSVTCQSTDASNVVQCVCLSEGSHYVPLTVIYIFGNGLHKSGIVYADVSGSPQTMSPSVQPSYVPTLAPTFASRPEFIVVASNNVVYPSMQYPEAGTYQYFPMDGNADVFLKDASDYTMILYWQSYGCVGSWRTLVRGPLNDAFTQDLSEYVYPSGLYYGAGFWYPAFGCGADFTFGDRYDVHKLSFSSGVSFTMIY